MSLYRIDQARLDAWVTERLTSVTGDLQITDDLIVAIAGALTGAPLVERVDGGTLDPEAVTVLGTGAGELRLALRQTPGADALPIMVSLPAEGTLPRNLAATFLRQEAAEVVTMVNMFLASDEEGGGQEAGKGEVAGDHLPRVARRPRLRTLGDVLRARRGSAPA